MGKRLKIAIVGLPLFAERLAKELSNYDKNNSYKAYNTYYSKKDALLALINLYNTDIVYSINGTLLTSRYFDLAFKRKVPVIMNWVGTDVLKAIDAKNSGIYRKDYLDNAIHFCEVNWIQEELASIDLHTDIVNFAVFDKTFELNNTTFSSLEILCYVSAQRSDFYGLPMIQKMALEFPDVNFHVAGMERPEGDELANINYHGWVNDMEHLFKKCPLVLRFTKHDGLSNFILEALARGKQVIYNNPFPNCHFVTNANEVSETIRNFSKQITDGSFKVNFSGAQYISENFNRKVILGGLCTIFNSISER